MTIVEFVKRRWYFLAVAVAVLVIYAALSVRWQPEDPEARPFKLYLPVKVDPPNPNNLDGRCERVPFSVVGGATYRIAYDFDQPGQTTHLWVFDKEAKLIQKLAQYNQGFPELGGARTKATQFDFLVPKDGTSVNFFLCNDAPVVASFSNVEIRKIGTVSDSPYYQPGMEGGLLPPALSPQPKIVDRLENWSQTAFHSPGIILGGNAPGPNGLTLTHRALKGEQTTGTLEPQAIIWKTDEPITRFRIGAYYLEEALDKDRLNVMQIFVSPDGKQWTPMLGCCAPEEAVPPPAAPTAKANSEGCEGLLVCQKDLISNYYPQPPGWALYTTENLKLPAAANYRYLKVEFPLYYQPTWAIQLARVEIN